MANQAAALKVNGLIQLLQLMSIKDTTIADSLFIYEYFLDYDPVTHEYGDVDEPTVHDYWNKNNREALRYYKLAANISDIQRPKG